VLGTYDTQNLRHTTLMTHNIGCEEPMKQNGGAPVEALENGGNRRARDEGIT